MRYLFSALALGFLLTAVGCSGSNRVVSPNSNQRVRLDKQPTAQQLVAIVNDNAARIPAIQCTDVTLDCRQGKDSGVVTGRIDCQKPRNFRLTGKVIGKPEVDMGSNSEEFWFWIPRADPHLFHCSYDALQQGARLPFPFHPDLVLTALGMGNLDPNRNYQVQAKGNTIELIDTTNTIQGQPLRRIIVFNRGPVNDNSPQILAHILQDANGREICTARVIQTQVDRSSGAILPRRVTINWPQQQLEMAIKLDNPKVVQMDPQLAQSIFSRRSLSNLPAHDLSQRPAQTNSRVQQAGFEQR